MEPPSSYLSPLMSWMKQMSLEKSCTKQHDPWGDIPLKGHHKVLALLVLLMWGEKTEKASGLLWIRHQEAPAELMHYLSYAQARDFKLLLGRREKSSQRELHQGAGPSDKNDNGYYPEHLPGSVLDALQACLATFLILRSSHYEEETEA